MSKPLCAQMLGAFLLVLPLKAQQPAETAPAEKQAPQKPGEDFMLPPIADLPLPAMEGPGAVEGARDDPEDEAKPKPKAEGAATAPVAMPQGAQPGTPSLPVVEGGEGASSVDANLFGRSPRSPWRKENLLIPPPDSSIFLEEPFRLPESSAPALPEVPSVANELRIPVSGFIFDGVHPSRLEDLEKLAQSYLDEKYLSSNDLESLRLEITRYYVKDGKEWTDRTQPEPPDDGYINSGAILPDQDPSKGIVEYKIIEGKLTDVRIKWFELDENGGEVTAKKLLWDYYLEARIRRGAGEPLHMRDLRDRLQLIQRNPNIKRINAELKPGAEPGESYLEVKIEPDQPYTFGVDFVNDRPPSVGAEQIELWAVHTSVTRNSDVLQLRYGVLETGLERAKLNGIGNFFVSYSIPVTPWDTIVDVSYEKNGFAIIEEPFSVLDLEGESSTFRFGIRQPIWETESDRVSLGLHVDLRHSETSLLGEPFSLTPGAVDGEIDIAVLRFSQEWVNRSLSHVFAARSSFNFGLDAFDATDNGNERNGKFFSWLGQAQLVRRIELADLLPNSKSDYAFQLILRGTLQATSDPLLSLEQFTIGGVDSVRGYRENLLVRDMAYLGSLEFRFPLIWNKRGEALLSFAPFLDVGGGWDNVAGGEDRRRETIASAGIGLVTGSLFGRLDASIYWGQAFQNFTFGDEDLQDKGIHFRVSLHQ